MSDDEGQGHREAELSSDYLSDSELRSMNFTEFEVTPRDLSQVDIQGIPWRLSEMTREIFRSHRYHEYQDFERRRQVRIWSGEYYGGVAEMGLYKFRMMNRMDSCSINHFQLRHLLTCPSLRGVYFPHLNRVRRWDPTIGKSEIAVELHEAILPRISSLLANEEFIFVGGIGGELIVAPAGQHKAKWFSLVSQNSDNIVTHIAEGPGRGCLVSSNDCHLRRYAVEGLRLEQTFAFDWSVNASVASPTSSLVCVVGDSTDSALVDLNSGKEASRISGHLDYSFACDWSADGRWLVTGNQDHTARVYDTRFLSNCLRVLKSNMAAVRSLRFSPDSSCLALMEADDFVHLYDASGDFAHKQSIDFFGETAGVAFSPDSSHFYIGIAGIERGGIFEYTREHASLASSLSSLIL